jgi:DNA-binding PucR family transcriptional regulator
VQTFQPKKKPKGGELTSQEQAENTAISRARMGIEHAIGGVKVYRIVREVFRNLRQGFDDVVMEIACGLHNLRLDYPLTAA